MTPPKGVKGQNRSYFAYFKNAISPSDYTVWPWDSYILIT